MDSVYHHTSHVKLDFMGEHFSPLISRLQENEDLRSRIFELERHLVIKMAQLWVVLPFLEAHVQ